MNERDSFSSDDEVSAIGRGLLDRSLPKSEWTHRGHFAATLWLLECRRDLVASRDMPALIRAYNLATGVANTDSSGYHETITQASIRAARQFTAAHSDLPLYERCNVLTASPLGRSGWLFEFWSRDLLLSVAARQRWMHADLKPFPY